MYQKKRDALDSFSKTVTISIVFKRSDTGRTIPADPTGNF